ncbi:MAG: hypothetical protein IT315_11735 [Anaerolineales bacterium]|nr:hypothetical protein [Anaerolineales bacterium]
MNPSRKYLGMTIPQLGVLAGLAGVLLLILCIGGWLILGGGSNTASPQQIPTAISPTATLIVTPTITPTSAPTAIPYEQLIPQGWVQHKTALVELWMPSVYKDSKLPIPEGEALAAQISLTLLQPGTKKTTVYNKWAVVSYEPLTLESLDSFLDVKIQSVPLPARVVERRKIELNGAPAVRVLSEFRENNLDVTELTYVFQDGGTVWYVSFWAEINEFYENIETFEKAALTFRLVK